MGLGKEEAAVSSHIGVVGTGQDSDKKWYEGQLLSDSAATGGQRLRYHSVSVSSAVFVVINSMVAEKGRIDFIEESCGCA